MIILRPRYLLFSLFSGDVEWWFFIQSQETRSDDFQILLNFLSSEKVRRNIEIADRLPERGGNSDIAYDLQSEGFDVNPSTVSYKRHQYRDQGLIDESSDWTELGRRGK